MSNDPSMRLFSMLKSRPAFCWMAVSQVRFGLLRLEKRKAVPKPVAAAAMADPYLYCPMLALPTVPYPTLTFRLLKTDWMPFKNGSSDSFQDTATPGKLPTWWPCAKLEDRSRRKLPVTLYLLS